MLLIWVSNAHKSLRTRNNATNIFSKCFCQSHVYFFPLKVMVLISTVRLQIVYIFLQSSKNDRTKVQETQDVFHTAWLTKDFGMSSQSNKVLHITRKLCWLAVCSCLLHKSAKYPTTALQWNSKCYIRLYIVPEM